MVAGHLQEKKGYYYMVLECKDENGKRKNKWISTGLKVKGNKKRAEQMLIDARQEYDESHQEDGITTILFADYMLDWLKMIRYNVSPSTFGTYQGNIERRIAPYFRERNIRLVDLQAKDIQDYHTYLMNDRGVSASTAILHHANIRKALQYAVQTDLIFTNPADKVERPHKEPYIGNFLTVDELNNLFQLVHGDKLEFAVVAGAFYGLRREEIMGLKWDAIDFKNKSITIRHTVTSVFLDGKQQEVERDRTKNQSSRRTLPLVPQFEALLLEMKQQQAYFQKICNRSYNNAYLDYIYVDEMGNRFKPKFITCGFSRFLKNHGLRHVRFHDLRHPYVKPTTKNFSTFLKFLCHGLIILLPHYRCKVCKDFTVPCQIHFAFRYSMEPYTVLAEIFPILNRADSRTADTVKVDNKHDVSQLFFHSPVDFQ